MRNMTVLMFALLAALCLPADDYPPTDITTIYGQTFKNAQIVNVNATTVDITYIDSYNMPVMRGVKLKDLTPELQAKFGYDPATAAENERKQAELRQNQFNQLKYQETQLQKKINLQVQQRQGGQNVPIDLNELYKVIYQGKIAVTGFVISYGKEGALVNVTGYDNDSQQMGDNIIILDLDAPVRSNWAGNVYPTMMLSSQRLGVYCLSPENAIDSVVATLKLDNSDTPDNSQSAAAPAAPAAPAATDGTTVSTTTTTGYSGVYIQSGGGYYYPTYVYPTIIQPPYIRPWPRPYPPRPYPPRPYPPHPPRDGDNDNNWPNRPGQDNNNNNNNWPNRPGQNNNNNNTPRPGQDNNTPRPGQDNNTPRPGQNNNNNNTPRPGQDNNTPRPGQDNNTPRPGRIVSQESNINSNINSWTNRPANQSGGENRGAGDRSNVAAPGTGTNVIVPGSGNYVPAGTGVPGRGWGNGWSGGEGFMRR